MEKVTVNIQLDADMAEIAKEAGDGILVACIRAALRAYPEYRRIAAKREREQARLGKELAKQNGSNAKAQAKADMEWQKLLDQVKAIYKKKGTVPMATSDSIMHKVLTPEQFAASVLRDISLDEGGTCYDGYRMSDSEDERRAKVALIGCRLLTLELMDEARTNSPFRSHFTVPAF